MKNSTIHQFEILDQSIDEFEKYCKKEEAKSSNTKQSTSSQDDSEK